MSDKVYDALSVMISATYLGFVICDVKQVKNCEPIALYNTVIEGKQTKVGLFKKAERLLIVYGGL